MQRGLLISGNMTTSPDIYNLHYQTFNLHARGVDDNCMSVKFMSVNNKVRKYIISVAVHFIRQVSWLHYEYDQ